MMQYNRLKFGVWLQHNHPALYGPFSALKTRTVGDDALEIVAAPDGFAAPSAEAVNAIDASPPVWAQLQGQLDALEDQRAKKIKRLRAVVAAALIGNGWTQDDTMLAGRSFFGDHGPAIRAYVDGAAPKFAEDVVSDDRAWLELFASPGVTIREVILAHVA